MRQSRRGIRLRHHAATGLSDRGPGFEALEPRALLSTVTIATIDGDAAESGASPTNVAAFRITRSDSAGNLLVNFAMTGTATFGNTGDFVLRANNVLFTGNAVTIFQGQSFVDVFVVPRDDNSVEALETATMTLVDTAAYDLNPDPATQSAAVNIADNDTQVSIAAQDATGAESGTPATNVGIFRITRQGVLTNDLVVNFSRAGTAVIGAGSDYTLSAGGVNVLNTATIPAGQSFVDITVTPVDDALAELTETVSLTLGTNAAYLLNLNAATAVVNIQDDEPIISIAAPDAASAESGSPATNLGTFRISRTGAVTDPLTVNFTRSGSAVFGVDYTFAASGADLLGLSVVIPAGQSFVDITLTPTDDVFAEGTESVTLALAASLSYTLDPDAADRSKTVTVVDNEPVISISATDNAAAESGTPATSTGTFRISRTGDTTNPVTVFFTRGGTAIFGNDYSASVGGVNLAVSSVVIPAGQTFVDIAINPLEDAAPEVTETVILTLSVGTTYTLDPVANNRTATVNLSDNEPVVSVTALDATSAESGNPPTETGTFRISRTGGTANPLTVFFTRAGTAILNSDYTFSVGGANLAALSVVIPAGAASVDIVVNPVDNATPEPTETVILTVVANALYHLDPDPADLTATVTIADDEPTVSIAALDAVAGESGSPPANTGTFRITRVGSLAASLVVTFARSGTGVFGPTGDYTLSVGGVNLAGINVLIPAGQASVDITVSPVDNLIPEVPEAVTLTLAASAAYTLDPDAADRTATVALLDDEPAVSIAAIDATAAESGNPPTDQGLFRITRTGPTTSPLTVLFTRTGTAVIANDYSFFANGQLLQTLFVVIPAGQASVDILVSPIDNAVPESTETVILGIAASAGAYSIDPDPADSSATVTIADNEPVVSIAATDNAAAESGAMPTETGTFRISRAGPTTSPLTVNIARSGTALFGLAGDYTLEVGGVNLAGTTVVIPAGAAFVDVLVKPVENSIAEQAETAILSLTAGAAYSLDPIAANRTATVNIADNEPLVTIAAQDAVAAESGNPPSNRGAFRISRTGPTTSALNVAINLTGTAVLFGTQGDYLLRIGNDVIGGTAVTIPAGASFVDVFVDPLTDIFPENTESVVMSLLANSAYNLGANLNQRQATVSILLN